VAFVRESLATHYTYSCKDAPAADEASLAQGKAGFLDEEQAFIVKDVAMNQRILAETWAIIARLL
jgi:hypothetical protein